MTRLSVEILGAVSPVVGDRGYSDSRKVVIPEVRQKIRDTSLLFPPLREQHLGFV